MRVSKRQLNLAIGVIYSALAIGGAVVLGQEQPPRHDKWREQEHAFCLPAKPSPDTQGHECHCKMMCATRNDGTGHEYPYEVEDQTCEMWCTKTRCACHPEETCDVPPAIEVPQR